METDTEYHWYTARDGVPNNDWMYLRVNDHYGFEKEPSYEVIEKYGLRFAFVGTWLEMRRRR